MYYNYDLYRQVKEVRKELGLSITETQIELTDHELLYKKVIKKETGVIYNVEKVFQCYELGRGFYKWALIENNGSHGCIYYLDEIFDNLYDIIREV